MRRILSIAALLVPLIGGIAHADQPVVLAGSGYWRAVSQEADGRPVCSIVTFAEGAVVVIAIAADELHLSVRVTKKSWRIPAGATVPMSLRFDSQPASAWDTIPATLIGGVGDTLVYPIGFRSARDFAQDITHSAVLTIGFGGNEPPWRIDLMGTSAVWGAFMACGNRINPSVVAQIAAPTQPYSMAPTRPYEPVHPYDVPARPHLPSRPPRDT